MQELAAKARVSREYIRKLEAGGYDPVGTLRRLAKALGVPVTELLEKFRRTKAMAGTGQFTHVSAVLTPDGMIVLSAVDDIGNIWKLLDQPAQQWNLLKNQRQG